MNIKIATIFIIISAILLFSCSKQTIPDSDVDLGKEYFPLKVGHFVEYAVDSIKYNDFTKKNRYFQL